MIVKNLTSNFQLKLKFRRDIEVSIPLYRSENGNFGNVRVHQLFINRGVSMSLIFPLAIQ